MIGRVKLKVYSEALKRWKTVYVKDFMAETTAAKLRLYGLKVRL